MRRDHRVARNSETARWRQADRRSYLHPFTDYQQLQRNGSRIITRAEGVYLWDSDGNRILDGMAGLWCVNVGYGRHELAEVARDQMRELPYYNSFFQTAHPPAIELTELLAEITPAGMNRAFLTNSGSEANDTVIRMARRYWDLMGEPDKKIIISRDRAYHGSTVGAASLSGIPAMHAQGGLPIPDIVHIEAPYWYANGNGRSAAVYGRDAARALEAEIEALGAERVAAFIGEPVQGAGGVIIPPDSYWPEIQRICKEYDILLVVDEVICGFGRMGKWFGCDYYHLEPDLMPIAKGLSSGYLPVAGVMLRDRVADVMIDRGGEFRHGFTYSGHPAACAVAAANIRILRDERIVERVDEDTGPYFRQRWNELGDHPLVDEARSIGFLGALELINEQDGGSGDERGAVGTRCRDLCMDNGLVMRAVYDTMIVSPPLIMSRGEIDELVTKAAESLDGVARELARAD
jgi:putrescine---pyruvate transaminase